jgi:predicted RNA methylase
MDCCYLETHNPTRTIAIRMHELAIKLQTLDAHPKPKAVLEQYTIPAVMLGAEYVVGVELDPLALKVAASNCTRMRLKADWVLTDIDTLRGPVDTVVMNPPFGTKRPHADIRFLQSALKIGKVVYSIHKATTREHLDHWFREQGSRAELIMTTKMEIPHQFSFHKKKKSFVGIDVFRVVKG